MFLETPKKTWIGAKFYKKGGFVAQLLLTNGQQTVTFDFLKFFLRKIFAVSKISVPLRPQILTL